MEMTEVLLSAPEVAKRLNLTPQRVGVLCKQGRFEGARKLQNRWWIIPEQAVENFIRLRPGQQISRLKFNEKKYLQGVLDQIKDQNQEEN